MFVMVADILNVGVNAANWLSNQRQRRREFDEHRRQFDLNYAQQQRQFETAIQTRVADLEAAGLHKSLAAGSQGASAPMATSGGSPKSSPLEARLGIMEVAKRQQELRQMRAQARLIEAQSSNVNADTDYKRQHLLHSAERHPEEMKLLDARYWSENELANHRAFLNRFEELRSQAYPRLVSDEVNLSRAALDEYLYRNRYLFKHGATPPTRNQMAVEIDQLLREFGEPSSESARIAHMIARILSRLLGR